jgi:hypothetical protein
MLIVQFRFELEHFAYLMDDFRLIPVILDIIIFMKKFILKVLIVAGVVVLVFSLLLGVLWLFSAPFNSKHNSEVSNAEELGHKYSLAIYGEDLAEKLSIEQKIM